MSSLLPAYSRFVYGFEVTVENNKIDFDEGAGALVAEIDPGNYSMGTYLDKVAEALNIAGLNTYAVTVARSTRIVTIALTGTATDFLFSSGSNASQSAASMMGFSATDHSNVAASLSSGSTAGEVYDPQFRLQNYIPPENSIQAAFATKNKSASGRVQVQKFGTESFMKCEIKYATNVRQPSGTGPIKDNATGLEDLRTFMNSITDQIPVEFYPDISDTTTYYTLILDSTADSKDGVGFELKEMNNYLLSGYFETGKLVFRVTEE